MTLAHVNFPRVSMDKHYVSGFYITAKPPSYTHEFLEPLKFMTGKNEWIIKRLLCAVRMWGSLLEILENKCDYLAYLPWAPALRRPSFRSFFKAEP
jgi:hypothetical protein